MIDDDNRPHVRAGDIKYTKGYRGRLFFSKLMNFLFLAVIFAIISGSMYVYVKQPVKTKNGYVFAEVTQRMFKPEEEIIYVSTDNYNMFTPLVRSVVNQETHKAKIIAGPYGKVKKYDEVYKAVYGENTVTVNLENNEEFFLNEEYIIRKISDDGSFLDEPDILVNKKEILGITH
jgi:hypothetical protein